MVTRRKSVVGGVWRKSPNPHALLITTRKSLKWTTKVFYLMEINVHNAYVLYLAQSRTKKYKHLSQFVLQLIKQLLPLEEPDAAETGGEGGCTAQIYISHCVHFATMISSVFVCLQPKSMNHWGHASSEEMTIQSSWPGEYFSINKPPFRQPQGSGCRASHAVFAGKEENERIPSFYVRIVR